jgi:hypothetical protein
MTTSRYVCHQCLRIIRFEEIAHVDLYSDVCWVQCDQCRDATGLRCGVDQGVNPRRHGYFACPYRFDTHAPPAITSFQTTPLRNHRAGRTGPG